MIEQLGYYLKANGTICKIESIDDTNEETDEYYDDMARSYYPSGRYFLDGECERDLIAHIPPALHFEVLRVIEAYHTQDSFKSIIDTCYKNHLEKKKEK